MEAKRCTKCHANKTPADFHKGNLWCKACVHIQQQRYYDENRTRRLQYAAAHRSSDGYGEKYLEYHKKWRTDNPLKRRAYLKVSNALRSGTIKKLPCEVCNEPNTQAHHHSYEERYWLDVTWFCRTHHMALHRRLRRGTI